MRFLSWFNLFGVLALAVLCGFQWTAGRRASLENVRLDMTVQKQSAKIAELETTIIGDKADLDEFRQRLEQSETAIKDAESRIVQLAHERDAVMVERDTALAEKKKANADLAALQGELSKWVDAVSSEMRRCTNLRTKLRRHRRLATTPSINSTIWRPGIMRS